MQVKGILKISSPVIIIVSFAMLLSSMVSIFYNENPNPLIIGSFSSLISGIAIFAATRKANTKNLGILEGCAIVTISWLISCLFGALPFFTMGIFDPSLKVSWTKSLFESVSGFTTTGATIFPDIESLPRGIIFWRSLSQWIGGMGIVVLAIAILPKIGIGGLQAYKMEMPGPLKNDKLMPRISQTAKILYRVYFTLSLALFISLISIDVGYFDAIIHTFSTIATGGFSNYNNSVAGLQNKSAEYIIAFFMWLAGINFSLIYFTIWKKKLKLAIQNTEFKVYVFIIIAAITAISSYLYSIHFNNWSFNDTLRHSIFQVSSIITTSGFSTTNYSLWPTLPITILMTLMLIGGCTGSTSGSLKILRHIISFKFIKWELLKIARPNLITSIKIGERAINNQIVRSVIVLLLIFLATFIVGTISLTIFDLDITTAASASIAGLAGIGPALNELGPAGNYASLHSSAQWVFIFLMFIGRLEIVTVLILFLPSVWLKK